LVNLFFEISTTKDQRDIDALQVYFQNSYNVYDEIITEVKGALDESRK